jgi:cytidylate kinase
MRGKFLGKGQRKNSAMTVMVYLDALTASGKSTFTTILASAMMRVLVQSSLLYLGGCVSQCGESFVVSLESSSRQMYK